MGKTKRTIETLYLDQDKLDLLKQVADETRIPRAVLAREAIDDLLAKHGKASSDSYDQLRSALKKARAIVVRYRGVATREALWRGKCDEALLQIDEALKAVGATNTDS
jgi:hypothetical protein